MSIDRACTRCGNRTGHGTELDDAHCAYRVASTAALRLHAQELDADKVAAADLLAHLRTVFSDPDAYAAARCVLDLGWRLTVGAEREEVA